MSSGDKALRRPLDGVRIVDLSTVLMGPYATQILADYGADVIKVEPPAGDMMRHAGPMKHAAMGPIFLQANRNKRSVVLDLKHAAGRSALLQLISGADVFVTNTRPAAMRRLSLGYEDLAGDRPGLIYASLVGFDQSGPNAPRPAYDDVIQAASGLAALTAMQNSGPPSYVPMVIADRIAGLNAAHTVLAALFMREKTGKGQRIEIPMFETLAALVMADHMGGETFIPAAGPVGYQRLLTRHRRPYKTKDGFVALLVYTDGQWRRFLQLAAGGEHLAADPRFASVSGRASHYDEIYSKLDDLLAERTTSEWVDLLSANDIPCMKVAGLMDLLSDPQVAAAGLIEEHVHPSEGRIRGTRVPARWSEADLSMRLHAPRLGEHSFEVLLEAGLSQRQIDELVAAGVTLASPDAQEQEAQQ